jgi:hypothetical protein
MGLAGLPSRFSLKTPVFVGPGSLAEYNGPQEFPVDKLYDVGVSQLGAAFVDPTHHNRNAKTSRQLENQTIEGPPQ